MEKRHRKRHLSKKRGQNQLPLLVSKRGDTKGNTWTTKTGCGLILHRIIRLLFTYKWGNIWNDSSSSSSSSVCFSYILVYRNGDVMLRRWKLSSDTFVSMVTQQEASRERRMNTERIDCVSVCFYFWKAPSLHPELNVSQDDFDSFKEIRTKIKRLNLSKISQHESSYQHDL